MFADNENNHDERFLPPPANNNNDDNKKYNIPPTLNISWFMATTLCIWFLFIHAPFVLIAQQKIDPLLYIHLFGAYSIYLTCVHNTLLTPSTKFGCGVKGTTARPFHIWIGRVGLILGVIGFITGFILTWFVLEPLNDLGFSIGISFGGIMQMILQYNGYRAIKHFQNIKAQIEASDYNNQEELFALQEEQDQHLSHHILCMINLFVFACGVPALIRVMAPIKGGLGWLPIFIGVFYVIAHYMSKPLVQKIKTKRDRERGVVVVTEESELRS